MTTAYPTPVTELSDEELETLSAELEEAYQSSDEDGFGYWSDDDAEQRYDAMKAETWRRFLLANPDYVAPPTSELLKVLTRNALECLQRNIQSSSRIEAAFVVSGVRKIGDTINVRRPVGFRVNG